MSAQTPPPGAPLWHDRDRGRAFGADPDAYDRLRPGYPPALVEELAARRPDAVLDVGCGTGKAGRPLAERGCRVLGVEPDERMAGLARRRGLDVERARFEDWEPAGRRFDMVISGQAWHWVEPRRGLARAVEVLRPGGWFAAFWNQGAFEPEIAARMTRLYTDVAPSLLGSAVVLGVRPRLLHHAQLEAISAHPGLGGSVERTYRWPQRYDRDQYLGLLLTHGDHRRLPDASRRRLLEAVGGLVDGAGGTLTVRYETYLVMAARTAPETSNDHMSLYIS